MSHACFFCMWIFKFRKRLPDPLMKRYNETQAALQAISAVATAPRAILKLQV